MSCLTFNFTCVSIMSTMGNNRDIEMFTLRRSARIAEKQRQKLTKTISTFNKMETTSQKVSKRKASSNEDNVVVKMNVDVQIKKRPRKTKNVRNNRKIIDKYINLEKTKLNDIFPLILKYASSEDEKNEKYIILKKLIKGRKAIKIDNFVSELYTHQNKIVLYLYNELLQTLTEYSFTLNVISNHLNDILSYKEFYDIDTIAMKQQTKDNQKGYDIQEVEQLNAMLYRLMM